MNKRLWIIAVLIIGGAALALAIPAYAANSTPVTLAAPLAHTAITSGAFCFVDGYGNCISDWYTETIKYMALGEDQSGNNIYWRGKIMCGEGHDIYCDEPYTMTYKITCSYNWHIDEPPGQFSYYNFQHGPLSSYMSSYNQSCGGPDSGSCAFFIQGEYTFNIGDSNFFQLDTGMVSGDHGKMCTAEYQLRAQSCEDDGFTPGEVIISTTVDAQDEDGNYHFLLPNQWYNLTTGGGPWYDVAAGGTGRYDLAYSYDRVTWWPIGGSITETGCIETYSSPEYVSWYFYMPLTGTLPGGAFYIRVNDQAGAFANNRDDMGYTIRDAVGPDDPYQPGTCPYLVYGDPWTLSVDATSVGGGPALPPGLGSFGDTTSVIAIEFTGPFTNGDGENDYDNSMNARKPGLNPQVWVPGQIHPHVACAENLGTEELPRFIYFLEIPYDEGWMGWDYYIRAIGYPTNTGTLTWVVRRAMPVDPPAACESNYIIGDAVASVLIPSGEETGVDVPGSFAEPLEINKLYLFETTGGPWLDNAVSSYNLDISTDDGSTWYDLSTWPGAACISPLGNQLRVYLQTQSGWQIKMRVNDDPGDFGDNTGEMGVNIYQAASTAVTCSDWALGDEIETAVIPPYAQAGIQVPYNIFPPFAFEDGSAYAIEIIEGPWYDNSIPTYTLDVSIDQRQTWNDFETFDGFGCVSDPYSDTNHLRGYFVYQAGQSWGLRVQDDDTDYLNNGGAIGYTLYGAYNNTPPPSTCDTEYSVITLLKNGTISSTIEIGEQETMIVNGGLYRLDTNLGPWHDNGVDSYGVQISDDGGGTWQDLADYDGASCVVEILPNYVRIYFIARSNLYRLRVDDGNANFADNSDYMGYTLYSVWRDDGGGTPPTTGDGNCDIPCSRPSGIDVPAWLEYVRCQFSLYLAWCPHHSDEVMEIQTRFEDYEPFGTIGEVQDGALTMQAILGQYQDEWDEGIVYTDTGVMTYGDNSAYGQPAPDTFAQIFTVADNSVYNGGDFDIGGISGEPRAMSATYEFSTACNFGMEDIVGSSMSESICWAFSVLDETGLMPFFQMFINVSALVGLAFYIQHKWIDMGSQG